MYKKSVRFNQLRIFITVFDTAVFSNDTVTLFGNPLGDINDKNHNNLKGHWIKFLHRHECLEIVTDIIAAYRLYYIKLEGKIYISDNYLFLLKKCQEISLDLIEYEYWKKHDYTTGGKTLFKRLNKFKPATVTVIKEDSITEKVYFKNLIHRPNSQVHTKKVFLDLKNTFESIKQQKRKVILMFSGGKDSCLLAFFLKHLDIDFIPVFLKLNPTFNQAYLDFQKVKQISQAINIQPDIIEVNIGAFTEGSKKTIHQIQLLDKHFTPIHFNGVEQIKKKYGEDILIVNGSTSDSIFSFGPSENSKISFLRRNIMFNHKSAISKIAVLLLNIKVKKRFRLGRNEDELLLALMDEYKYCRVLDKDKGKGYYKHLLEQLSFARKFLKTFASLEMYAKNLTFLQGSTQQIVHNSCKFHGLRYIMPFASPEILYATLAYRDSKLEIKNPKYCVGNILNEEFNFNYESVKLEYKEESFSYNLDELRNKIDLEFETSLKEIMADLNL